MTKTSVGKWTFGIAGTIFLGAIGSGLWDVLLKSFFTFVSRATLTAISFGYSSIRDSYYLEIAKGHTDRASLWLVTFSLMPLLFGFSAYFGYIRGRQSAQAEADEEEEHMQRDLEYHEQRLCELDGELKTLEHKLRMANRGLLILSIFFLSFFVFRAVTLSYISSAITHYEQSFAICLPWLSEQERSLIRSEYAQIRTREDYVKVLDKLHTTADSHGLKLPSFNPW